MHLLDLKSALCTHFGSWCAEWLLAGRAIGAVTTVLNMIKIINRNEPLPCQTFVIGDGNWMDIPLRHFN